MGNDVSWLEKYVRDVPDFPTVGITFKDLTPLLGDARAFRAATDALVAVAQSTVGDAASVDKVVGVEARGFTFAATVAYQLGAGLVPVRKPDKLPHDRLTETYELEYGTDTLEIHRDAVAPGEKVFVVDDVLATGGTALATSRLVEGLGGEVVCLGFVIELGFLNGRAKLSEHEVQSLIIV